MTDLTFTSLYPIWPELLLAISAFAFLMVGVVRGNIVTPLLFKSLGFLMIVMVIVLLGLPVEKVSVLNDMFTLDRFALFAKIAMAVGMFLVCLLSARYVRDEHIQKFEYPVLLILATLGMFMMVSANHMMSFYIGLELQSLSLYVLASFRSNCIRSTEAGLKYFILGAISSGFILFGISLIYGFTGGLSYTDIAANISQLEGDALTACLFGVVFLVSGIAFKISAVPFHMWTPDVYEGAPSSVTALFAMVPKIAALAALIRMLAGPFEVVFDQIQLILIFLSVMSMFWGAFAGLAQTNLKRLMAYSSIGNIGYALIGVIIGTPEGYAATLYYMILYMIMSAGVFAVIMFMRRDGRPLNQLQDLAGLSKTHPIIAYAMALLMFSLSGIPPLAGFFGKLFVFQSAVIEGFYILAIVGVVASVISAAYYIRIIKIMFFDEESESFDEFDSSGRRFVLVLSAAFTLLLILFPYQLLNMAQQATQTLPLLSEPVEPDATLDIKEIKDEPNILDN